MGLGCGWPMLVMGLGLGLGLGVGMGVDVVWGLTVAVGAHVCRGSVELGRGAEGKDAAFEDEINQPKRCQVLAPVLALVLALAQTQTVAASSGEYNAA